MSLNVNYIKVLSTITIVFTSINNSYSDVTKSNQINTTHKLLQVNNKQVNKNQQSQDIKQNLTLLEQKIKYPIKNNQQTMQTTLNNTQLLRKNAIKQSTQDKLNDKQLVLNTNNNVNPAPVPIIQQSDQNKSNNQQILLNKTPNTNTTFHLDHKDNTLQQINNIEQFINKSNEIKNKININKNKIQNAFNKSFGNRSIKNKILYKQKGEDTKAILQILLGSYSNLYKTCTQDINDDYNGVSKHNTESYKQDENNIKIKVQQLEYDKCITNVLQTEMNKYKTNNDYKKEGWYTKKEFDKFCTLLSQYISDFDMLRTEFLELCNKYLSTLKQQVQQQLPINPIEQLNNCTSNSIQYIINTINNILLIIDNQFDKEKLGKNTNELKQVLLENKDNLLKISEYISNFLKCEIIDETTNKIIYKPQVDKTTKSEEEQKKEPQTITNKNYAKSLNRLIEYYYKIYLLRIKNYCYFYTEYNKNAIKYKEEGCKSKFIFESFINSLITMMIHFTNIFDNTILNEYNKHIMEVYPAKSKEYNNEKEQIAQDLEKEEFINISQIIQSNIQNILSNIQNLFGVGTNIFHIYDQDNYNIKSLTNSLNNTYNNITNIIDHIKNNETFKSLGEIQYKEKYSIQNPKKISNVLLGIIQDIKKNINKYIFPNENSLATRNWKTEGCNNEKKYLEFCKELRLYPIIWEELFNKFIDEYNKQKQNSK